MENNKKDLTKKAFAALLLAASLPVASHATEVETQGTLLAQACGASKSGCGAATSDSSYGNPASYGTGNPYNRSTSSYGTGAGNYDTSSGTYGGSSNYPSQGYGSTPGYGGSNSYNPPGGSYNRPGSGYSSGGYNSGFGSGSYMDPDSAQPPQRTNPNGWNR